MLINYFKILISIIYSSIPGIFFWLRNTVVTSSHLAKHSLSPSTILLLLRVYVKNLLLVIQNFVYSKSTMFI